jgi:hypothetical protein
MPDETEKQRKEAAERYRQKVQAIKDREVFVNGRWQCPEGCDLFVGGCIVHADNC